MLRRCLRASGAGLVVALLAVFPARARAHIGTGIAVDSDGRVYFADTIHNLVWRIDPDGKLTQVATNEHTNGLALLEDGSLYVVEGAVRRIIPPIGATGAPPSIEFRTGTGVALTMDKRGNVYFLNTVPKEQELYQIIRRTPEGVVTILAGRERGYADGKGVDAKFSRLNYATCGPDGLLYVRDGNQIRKVTPDGVVSTLPGGQIGGFAGTNDEDLQRPLGLAADDNGNVYVANYRKRQVFRITPAGEVHTVARSTWPWIPTGVATAADDVYVLERSGNPFDFSSLVAALLIWEDFRVRKITPSGEIKTLATVGGATRLSLIAWGLFICGLATILALALIARWLIRRRSRPVGGQCGFQ